MQAPMTMTTTTTTTTPIPCFVSCINTAAAAAAMAVGGMANHVSGASATTTTNTTPTPTIPASHQGVATRFDSSDNDDDVVTAAGGKVKGDDGVGVGVAKVGLKIRRNMVVCRGNSSKVSLFLFFLSFLFFPLPSLHT